jgi:positive regulator of sigma E activity
MRVVNAVTSLGLVGLLIGNWLWMVASSREVHVTAAVILGVSLSLIVGAQFMRKFWKRMAPHTNPKDENKRGD